jgi:4a-hydroxytetrahydrobiopterin dehydratase
MLPRRNGAIYTSSIRGFSGEGSMASKLSDSEIQKRLAAVPGWTLENGEITQIFSLPSFPTALLFVNAVGLLAEQANHHPDILIKYRKVKLTLVTHDSGGLTDKDFALAGQINALPHEFAEPAKSGK